MAEADENGDGEIDFEEFKNMMKKLKPAHEGEEG
jgi:Ca2+-binding EF-hand superfamily protein